MKYFLKLGLWSTIEEQVLFQIILGLLNLFVYKTQCFNWLIDSINPTPTHPPTFFFCKIYPWWRLKNEFPKYYLRTRFHLRFFRIFYNYIHFILLFFHLFYFIYWEVHWKKSAFINTLSLSKHVHFINAIIDTTVVKVGVIFVL